MIQVKALTLQEQLNLALARGCQPGKLFFGFLAHDRRHVRRGTTPRISCRILLHKLQQTSDWRLARKQAVTQTRIVWKRVSFRGNGSRHLRPGLSIHPSHVTDLYQCNLLGYAYTYRWHKRGQKMKRLALIAVVLSPG